MNTYLFALINFTVNKQEIFQTVSAQHNVNTKKKYHLYGPTANISRSQKVHIMLDQNRSAVRDAD
jgi:hypothetical protein